MNFSWTCPYCGQPTTITDPNCSQGMTPVTTEVSKYEKICIVHVANACPNQDCKELSLLVSLNHRILDSVGRFRAGSEIHKWKLLPQSSAKPQPDYIPSDIRATYYEACSIASLSPKASAALSRRCLQGILRDFWKIPYEKRGNFGAELNFVSGNLAHDTYQAIVDLREIGDIGAHMDKSVDQIVDIDPEEAGLLISLIENLFQDWYVESNKRAKRNAALRATVASKRSALKDAKNSAKTNKPSDSQK